MTSALEPYMPRDTLLQIAWVDGLRWALGEPGIVAAFREKTGNRWQPAKTPLDRMVDAATGADLEFVKAFAAWFNEHIWGQESEV
jgi:hypothetical protein